MDEPATSSARGFYRRHAALVWALVILVPLAILVLGVLLDPTTFYDHYVWQNLWGPMVADAHQVPTATYHGVVAHAGYTLISEATYGVVLAILLVGVYVGILRRFRIATGGRFLLGLLPLIVYGPLARVMEDANVFYPQGGQPSFLAYLFISPVIYLQAAVLGIAFLLLGVVARRGAAVARDSGLLRGNRLPLAIVASALGVEVFGYAFIATYLAADIRVAASLLVVLAAAVLGILVYAWGLPRWGADVNLAVLVLGLPPLAVVLDLAYRWVAGTPWSEVPLGQHPTAGAIIVALALAVTLIVYLVGRFGGPRVPALASYAMGLNLAMLFGQMIDGFATYTAIIDPFHLGLSAYGEKHPVSNILLGYGGGLAFPIVKLLMVLVIIYLLDQEIEPDLQDTNLLGLVKLAIFVLGFGPGFRDLTRVVMGI